MLDMVVERTQSSMLTIPQQAIPGETTLTEIYLVDPNPHSHAEQCSLKGIGQQPPAFVIDVSALRCYTGLL